MRAGARLAPVRGDAGGMFRPAEKAARNGHRA